MYFAASTAALLKVAALLWQDTWNMHLTKNTKSTCCTSQSLLSVPAKLLWHSYPIMIYITCGQNTLNTMTVNCNYVKFWLCERPQLTNRFHCNTERETLMNRLPVLMMPIGEKEFNTKAWAVSSGFYNVFSFIFVILMQLLSLEFCAWLCLLFSCMLVAL